MEIAESFISINGEGFCAGELSYFIRFKGCNLFCKYCDTRWANDGALQAEHCKPIDVANKVFATGIKSVTLTGGEPLLQDELPELLRLLLDSPVIRRVEVETNGSIDICPYCGKYRPIFTLDYKLPFSNCEYAMKISNYEYLLPDDTVKFVIGDIHDLDRATEIIQKYGLTSKCHVYFSPVFGVMNPAQIVNYMIHNNLNGIRLQIQIHKAIWGADKRGV